MIMHNHQWHIIQEESINTDCLWGEAGYGLKNLGSEQY